MTWSTIDRAICTAVELIPLDTVTEVAVVALAILVGLLLVAAYGYWMDDAI